MCKIKPMSDNDIKYDQEKNNGLLVLEPKTGTKTARPPLYKVILLNDDYTPMDFVVHVLKQFFHKNNDEAIKIMLEVHKQGSSLCGVFTRDVAETKIEQVASFARKNEHPLQCVMEKE
ncbi:MAG: ATP-dependent Clp protease adapter ClpS [Pseudomonadota bacterium]